MLTRWTGLVASFGLLTGAALGEIRLDRNDNQTVIRAAGLGAGRLDVFVDAETAGATAMMGSLTTRDGDIVFAPRFGLNAGMKYRAVFTSVDRKAEPVVAHFEIPAAVKTAVGLVAAIYPTADVLPENQLKMYVEFSVPMSRGEAYKRVRLKDGSGKVVPLAFLEIEEELWDRESRRLTLLLDPGRIKRGLIPHNEAGSAILDGQVYTLEVDRDWQDAEGRPLVEGARKEFRGGPADRVAPEIAHWIVDTPGGGSMSPLTVRFGEPLDRALIERLINVVDASGRDVAGRTEITAFESEWRFVPAKAWAPGAYKLRVGSVVEDLAGNRMGRLFDVDRFDRVDKKVETSTLERAFVISARSR